MIRGDDHQRNIQPGETAVRNNDNCAFVRTDQRLAAEAAMRKPEVTKTRQQLVGEAYGNACLREQEAKAKACKIEQLKNDNIALQNGTLKFVDGLRLEKDHGVWFVITEKY